MKKSLIPAVLLCLAGMLSAQSVEDLMSRGEAALNDKNYDQAVTIFRNVVAREPSNFEAQYNLALSYFRLDRFSNAAQEFNKAIALSPQHADSWYYLAGAYDGLGQQDRVIQALNRAIQLDPNHVKARMQLGRILTKASQYDRAKEQFRAVIEIDGSVAEAHGTLGYILFHKEDNPREALVHYARAANLAGRNPAYWEGLALVHEALKNKDEAIVAWRRCMDVTDSPVRREEIQHHIETIK